MSGASVSFTLIDMQQLPLPVNRLKTQRDDFGFQGAQTVVGDQMQDVIQTSASPRGPCT